MTNTAAAGEPVETIELRLAQVTQLYNTLDPSPFPDKELDPDADEFIVSWLREIGHKPFRIAVHLPKAEAETEAASKIAPSIRNHFANLERAERRKLRHSLRIGRTRLLIGLTFLGACLLARDAIAAFVAGPHIEFVREGLLIAGWVAMWGPLDSFLYGWWPILGNARLYSRLAKADVSVKVAP